MFAYRVDKRIFQVDDTILPQTNYEGQLSKEIQEMEFALNTTRAKGIPLRSQCLFLFKELSSALIFFGKYGGNIYTVEVEDKFIYHVGDMNKLDNILDVFRYTDCPDLRLAVINEYWKGGTHTFHPCYEILVSQAIIKKILLNKDVAELYTFNEEFKKYRTVEGTTLYRRLFAEIWNSVIYSQFK